MTIVKPANRHRKDAVAMRLLTWFQDHGRRHLPWQREPTPYRVWVSEIMLQQTQVATVIAYFEAFMARFPDVEALAVASQDDVLALWSGLGYYARARYLHRAAGIVVEQYNAALPTDIDALMALPGIGRSTAGAILSLSSGQSHAILDGNVKRVLARFHGVAGWPGKKAVADRLWHHARTHTPATHCAAYTQAIMDLGASICTRHNPKCERCPLRFDCYAYAQGRVHQFPGVRARRAYPVREKRLLVALRDHAVLLEKRAPTGIWGGLWSFPELDDSADADRWCTQHGLGVKTVDNAAAFTHDFSHFRLHATPVVVAVTARGVMSADRFVWYVGQAGVGLPAPIRKWLDAHLS